MRRVAAVLLVASACPAATLRQIKVVGNEVSSRETVASFFQGAAPGDTVSEDELRGLCRRAEERLAASQWYYRAHCEVVESVSQPGSWNVVLDVEDGFRDRYWGGNAFAGWGAVNAWGTGWEIRGEAGWNRQFLSILREHGPWHPILFEAWAGRRDSTLFPGPGLAWEDVPFVVGGAGLGVSLPADVSAWIEDGIWREIGRRSPGPVQNRLGLVLRRDTRDDAFSPLAGTSGRIEGRMYGAAEGWSVRGDGTACWSPHPRLTLALRGAGGWERDPGVDDLPGLGTIDGVRSPSGDSLVGEWTGTVQAEARLRIWRGLVLGALDLSLEGVAFADRGFSASSASVLGDFRERDGTAFGGGLRLWFGNPVFVPLRFEAGWNPRGQGKFLFAVERAF